jgi:hypothetical protein
VVAAHVQPALQADAERGPAAAGLLGLEGIDGRVTALTELRYP